MHACPQDSFGGNCKTQVIVCVSAAEADMSETVASLQFGASAMLIRNAPVPNLTVDVNTLATHLLGETLESKLLVCRPHAWLHPSCCLPCSAAAFLCSSAVQPSVLSCCLPSFLSCSHPPGHPPYHPCRHPHTTRSRHTRPTRGHATRAPPTLDVGLMHRSRALVLLLSHRASLIGPTSKFTVRLSVCTS